MTARRPVPTTIGTLLVLTLAAGCGVRRIEDGVYHSPKGYRVALPPTGWTVVESRRVDLELRHGSSQAGILINAACDGAELHRTPATLVRELLIGIRDRTVVDESEVPVNGRRAARAIVEGTTESRIRVRAETVVVKGDHCVYDLMYAAPADRFESWRPDFDRVVDSFAMEAGR